ncbi:cystinosin homolog isoform X2 [Cryptomeria japonica]|uniref:cystinosin homolog isoform X2 n=1 Tax=Cryptomeria japonica TaxID=3369 RepID=UPI0027DA2947|nr:cystinosin homolog isoform X2 [Cryptomeria japonica]
MGVSWNSVFLETFYQILGWFAFSVWSFSFYPQVLLNYRRKSVVGLNLDFLVFNLTKHSSYLIYNAALFFSPVVQRQYHQKYGYNERILGQLFHITQFEKFGEGGQIWRRFWLGKEKWEELGAENWGSPSAIPGLHFKMIPVAPNDVAFSIHAVLLTAFTIYQVFIYERGTQKVSKTCIGITVAVWGYAAISLIIAWPDGSWLWLVTSFNLIQVVMTAIKYIPQAWMNFTRKSTEGWSIGNILLDLSGGIANFMQMGVQSIDQNSLKNFYGNIGKLLLSLETIMFDIIFTLQHYVFYLKTKVEEDKIPNEDALARLLNESAKENDEKI